jgi:hypothetical protein
MASRRDNKSSPRWKLPAFRVRNRSERAVRLSPADTTCNCARPVSPVPSVLEPGHDLILAVQATPPAYGSRQATITIETDDPVTPTLRISLVLRGEEPRAPFVTYQSGDVRLVGTRPGDPLGGLLAVRTVESTASAPWLLASQYTAPGLSVATAGFPSDSPLSDTTVYRDYEFFIIASTPASEDEPLALALRLRGSCPATRPAATVSISASLSPPIRAVPRELFFEVPSTSDAPTERVIAIVSSEAAHGFDVSIEEIGAEWLEFETARAANGSAGCKSRVVVHPKLLPNEPGLAMQVHRAIVHVRGNDEARTIVAIPVTVFVQGAAANRPERDVSEQP